MLTLIIRMIFLVANQNVLTKASSGLTYSLIKTKLIAKKQIQLQAMLCTFR